MKVEAEAPAKPPVFITLTWDEARALRQLLGQVETGSYEKRLGTLIGHVVGDYDSSWRPTSVGEHREKQW